MMSQSYDRSLPGSDGAVELQWGTDLKNILLSGPARLQEGCLASPIPVGRWVRRGFPDWQIGRKPSGDREVDVNSQRCMETAPMVL